MIVGEGSSDARLTWQRQRFHYPARQRRRRIYSVYRKKATAGAVDPTRGAAAPADVAESIAGSSAGGVALKLMFDVKHGALTNIRTREEASSSYMLARAETGQPCITLKKLTGWVTSGMLSRGYLYRIGVALPDEKGGDVSMDGSAGDNEDHGEGAESGDDTGVAGGVPVQQHSTSVANHTSTPPLGAPQSPSTTLSAPRRPKDSARDGARDSALSARATDEATGTPRKVKGGNPARTKHQREVRAGDATLAEPDIVKAHQVVAERLGGSQAHDPNAIQLADGSWGTVVQRENGTNIFLPAKDKPGIQSGDEFEQVVNEIVT